MSSAQVIGARYEILEILGQGGMATVYYGRDLQLDQTVAIKLLKPEILEYNPDLTERFTREAEALRVLNHPNIVKSLALIEHEGQHYVVMEYVPGGDMRELLESEGPLPVQRVLEIALDLADALTRAHRLKIIHRDLKPGNVLMAEDGTPRLTDFGIARIGDSRMTQTGQLMGTLAYLSPEGCTGDILDARTDIWSFGVMLFEMLAGRRPFEDTDGNQAALLLAILSQPLPDLAALRPDAPPALVRLIERMLEKDRDERIQSVRQIGAQLEAIIEGRDSDVIMTDSGLIPPVSDPAEVKTPTRQMLEQFQDITGMQSPLSKTGTNLRRPLPDRLPKTPVPEQLETLPEIHIIPGNRRNRGGWLALAAVIGLLVIAAGVLLIPRLLNPATDPAPGDDLVAAVEPVEADELMILLAQLEPIDGAETEVSRFIFDDLQRKFEVEVPSSRYRVRLYPGVLTSEQQAAAVAEATGAVVIMWGDYDGTTARVNVQGGSLDAFGDLVIDREMVDRLTGARYLITNPREQSLMSAVVSVMNAIQTADNNSYEIVSNLTLLDLVKPTAPDIEGVSIGAQWHRYLANFLATNEAGFAAIDAAISLDGGNPILYMARGFGHARAGRLEEARRDLRTGGRLAPAALSDDLSLGQIELVIENDPAASLPYYDAALAIEPDNWLGLMQRGAAYYLLRQFDAAKQDLERAAELKPDFSLSYPFLMALALREGDLLQAQTYFHILQADADPTFGERLIAASFDATPDDSPLIAVLNATTSFTLLQWDTVLDRTAVTIQQESFPLEETYLMRGVAFCNQQDYAAAEAEYTQIIDSNPDYTLAYFLRAESRLKQGNILGAGTDFAAVLASPQANMWTPFVPAYRDGELSCENFFDADLRAYLLDPDATTPEVTPAS